MSTLLLTDEVKAVLNRGRVEGIAFFLPQEQLERSLYVAVNKVLENAGGAWSKKQKAHLFPSDPTAILDLTLTTGAIENKVDDVKAKRDKLQAFYTPEALAKRVVELADVEGQFVLEPEAGEGALVKAAIAAGAKGVTGIEIDPEAFLELQGISAPKGCEVSFYNEDFMKSQLRPGDFDRVVMNPPFSNNQDIKHVERALSLLRSGGILVAVMSPNTSRKAVVALMSKHRHEIEEVEAGTFEHTDIRTIILTIHKQ